MSNRIKSIVIITFLALLPLTCIAQTSWSNLGEKAASYAIDLEGATYGLGAKGYDGAYLDSSLIKKIDCSGLVVWAFNKANGPTIISSGAPIFTNDPFNYHSAAYLSSDDINQLIESVPDETDLETGDLLFLKNTDDSDSGVDHVGMYVGNGNVIHAKGPNSIGSVEVETLNDWFDLICERADGSKFTYRELFAGYGSIKDSFREGLQQLKQNGDKIASGDKIDDRTVVFKAKLNHPDGKKVKLEVELRRLDEYGGNFVDSSSKDLEKDYKISEPVTSGDEATAYAYSLIDGDYHWRARAVSDDLNNGLIAGDWVNFGCDISKADFTVSASTPTQDDRLGSEYSDLEEKSIENVRKVIDSYLVLASSYGSSSISYDVIGAKSFGKKTDAARYMNDMGITYEGTQEALAIIDTYGLEDTEFCVVIVKYNFVLFGQDISLLTPAICDEKGETIGYKAFQDLMQGYSRSR